MIRRERHLSGDVIRDIHPMWAMLMCAVLISSLLWLLWPKRPVRPPNWFFDTVTGKVYQAPSHAVAPYWAPSGPEAGVKAVIFPTRGSEVPVVAYLETMTPEAAAAMRQFQRNKVTLSDQEKAKLLKNIQSGTLVKRCEGNTWEPTTSAAGKLIVQSYLTTPGTVVEMSR